MSEHWQHFRSALRMTQNLSHSTNICLASLFLPTFFQINIPETTRIKQTLIWNPTLGNFLVDHFNQGAGVLFVCFVNLLGLWHNIQFSSTYQFANKSPTQLTVWKALTLCRAVIPCTAGQQVSVLKEQNKTARKTMITGENPPETLKCLKHYRSWAVCHVALT